MESGKNKRVKTVYCKASWGEIKQNRSLLRYKDPVIRPGRPRRKKSQDVPTEADLASFRKRQNKVLKEAVQAFDSEEPNPDALLGGTDD